MHEPLVSVIIPTYNNESTLDACLKSIKEQAYKNTEIIVADKFSTDSTRNIAKKYNAKIIEDNSMRSIARNMAVDRSIGEFVIFIDSDMELTERVIEECIMKSKEYDSIIIPEISFGIGFWANCKALEKRCYIGDDAIEAARFFSKKCFKTIGGYDPSLEAGEDWDIHQRIKKSGFRVGRVDTLIRHNEGHLGLWKTMKKKYYYGKTIINYKKKHSNEFSNQSKLIRPAFMNNWKLLIRNPITSSGMLVMKFCEFTAAYVGYIDSRIWYNENRR